MAATGNILSDNDGFGVDSDADTSDTLTVTQVNTETDPAVDVTGLYGTLDWDASGNYSYTVDNGNAAVQALAVGETLTDTFTYTLFAGTSTDTASLTITISGPILDSNRDVAPSGPLIEKPSSEEYGKKGRKCMADTTPLKCFLAKSWQVESGASPSFLSVSP